MEQRYKKILLTGGNSFLGTNVLLTLAGRGVEVRAIVRQTNPVMESCPLCEVIRGNVMERGDLLEAAVGCDAIVHIAAITDQSLLHYEQYRKFNVGALDNVVEVARATGIKRVVFVSSANAIGNGTPDHLADETTPLAYPLSELFYGRSKVEAEARLRQATDLDYTILNPCLMLGAYDGKPSSGAIIMMGYGKRLVFATPGGKNIVSVRAASEALCNAIERGRNGENYLLAGVNISVSEFFRLLAKRTSFRTMVITIPAFLLIWAGYVGDLLRWCGVSTQVSSINMRIVCQGEYYLADKAERELGLEATDLGECIGEAVDWFVSNGMLRPLK